MGTWRREEVTEGRERLKAAWAALTKVVSFDLSLEGAKKGIPG